MLRVDVHLLGGKKAAAEWTSQAHGGGQNALGHDENVRGTRVVRQVARDKRKKNSTHIR